jgi:1,4-dihydroxy-2-naphthoate polyprenyltransferase
MGKDNVRVWIGAMRPKTLPAGLVPVLLGAASVAGEPHADYIKAIGCALVALGLQVAVNFANDADDSLRGADTGERRGPTRAVQSGAVSPRAMRAAVAITLMMVAAVAAAIVPLERVELWVAGALAMLAALAYTGAGVAYGYKGWGEAICAVFFGPVAVMGTTAVVAGVYSLEGLLLGVACGAMAVAILEVNNIRDIPTDIKAKKMTLAAKGGKALGLKIYKWALMLALVATAAVGSYAFWALSGVLLILIVGGRLYQRLTHADRGAQYNDLLRDTALLQLIWGVAVAVGVMLG